MRVTPCEHTRLVPTVTVPASPAAPAGAGACAPDESSPAPRASGAADLLTRLRAPGRARPVVDAGLAGGLRAWLEDAVAPSVRPGTADAPGVAPISTPIVVGEGECTPREAVARAVFLLVVDGVPVRHPLDDALAVLSVDERGARIADSLRHATPSQRAALRRDAALCAGAAAAQWHQPPAAWLPRIGERLRVPLAGGRVVLAATADLALGGPAEDTASVCMVEVRLAAPSERDRRSRRFLALTETLRSGAPPLRVATYHPATGDMCCDEVSDEMLALAVDDVVGALAEPRVAEQGVAAQGEAARGEAARGKARQEVPDPSARGARGAVR